MLSAKLLENWIFRSEGSQDGGLLANPSGFMTDSTQSKQSKSNSTKYGEIQIMTLHS